MTKGKDSMGASRQFAVRLRRGMLLWFALFWMCQWVGGSSKDAKGAAAFPDKRTLWYGPSYRPRWWHPEPGPILRSTNFAYDGSKGPEKWPELFEECGARHQSPINVQTNELLKKKTKKPLKWVNYSKIPKSMILENSGHSIHANGLWRNSSQIPYITNGPLEQRYYFSQVHFHWGKAHSSKGSEHTVNNKSFPVEMHVVHDRLLEDPTNLSEESNSDHLVVVSYMFELIAKYNSGTLYCHIELILLKNLKEIGFHIDESDNVALEPILEGSRAVEGSEKKKTNIPPFPLEELLQPFHGDYVSYRGSLTTPPCTEGVIWLINSKPLGISKRQLAILRNSVKNQSGYPIKNYRPVQPVNGRNVYYIYC